MTIEKRLIEANELLEGILHPQEGRITTQYDALLP